MRVNTIPVKKMLVKTISEILMIKTILKKMMILNSITKMIQVKRIFNKKNKARIVKLKKILLNMKMIFM